MTELKFASEYAKEQTLTIQIAEAAKDWRIAVLEYEKAKDIWYHEAVQPQKDSLYEKMKQRESVRDGLLAKLSLLTDEYIEITGNP